MQIARLSPATTVLVGIATLALYCPSARAGTYIVSTCGSSPPFGHTAWSVDNTSPATLESGVECPASQAFGGLSGVDKGGASQDTPTGSHVQWLFHAPSGTSIAALSVHRWLGKRGSNSWTVYGRLGDGTTFDTCSFDPAGSSGCEVGFPAENGGSLLDLKDLATDRIVFGIECASQTSVCANGAAGEHLAWAVLYQATVTLSDPSEPSLTSFVDPGPGWLRQTARASWSTSDNSGISSTAARVDGANLSNVTLSCDRSQPVPCPPSADASHVLDLRRLADGPHTLSATATDAAGNVARSNPRTILVDNHAPGAPQGMQVAGGGAWRLNNAFDVTWAVPGQAPGSPVSKVHWRLCAADGACEGEHVVDGAVGELRGLSVPREGDWTMAVWLEDVAGNVAEASAGKVHVRFGKDPLGAGRASAQLRLVSFLRRAGRVVVRGRLASGVRGNVVVRVRRVPTSQARPRVARKVRVSRGHGGDLLHRPVSVVRVVRPARR